MNESNNLGIIEKFVNTVMGVKTGNQQRVSKYINSYDTRTRYQSSFSLYTRNSSTNRSHDFRVAGHGKISNTD